MAVWRTWEAVDEAMPEWLSSFLRNRVHEIAGTAVFLSAIITGLSILSWSALDPSFNNATSKAPDNLLGSFGAALADGLLQIFGLASIALAGVLAVWGWRLASHKKSSHVLRRIAGWGFGALLLAGGLSVLPALGMWPLPSGLGGAGGDILMSWLSGMLQSVLGPGIAHLLAAIIMTAAGLASLLYACSLGLADIRGMTRFFGEEGRDAMVRSAGAATHAGLSARAMWRRLHREGASLFSGKKEQEEYEEEISETDKPLWRRLAGKLISRDVKEPEIYVSGARIEPEFFGGPEPASPQNSARVQRSKAKIRPGKRIKREAEPELPFSPPDTYELPCISLLSAPRKRAGKTAQSDRSLEQNARLLEGVLEDFGIRGEIIKVRPGPVVTLYELQPAPGIKSSRVIGLSDDIARSMSAISVRIAVIPGRNVIGIELPNATREFVYLHELVASSDYEKTKIALPLVLGKTIGGDPVITDLSRMPHLLIAGTTGSGKSVGINTMILSLLYRLPPEKCKMIMIDPKMLELSVYDGIPHLLTPVVTEPGKAVVALKWTVREMETRYQNMSKLGVRNIDGYNARVEQAIARGEVLKRKVQTGFDRESGQAVYEEEELDLKPMPFIVVIVDEMADLMMVAGKDIEGAVQRLAQMARAAGIHLITATQRPSVDVITGTIKANFPTRISFQVTSKIDSRTILGEMGAEQLLGQGDMLYMAGGGRITRVHGAFVSDREVEKIVAHLKTQGTPDYLEAVTRESEDGDSEIFGMSGGTSKEDQLYDRAIAVVAEDRKVSTSYIQRKLAIGYNRAANVIERMEDEGVISPANHAGKREILLPEPDEFF